MDPGPSPYVALRKRRAARPRVLVVVGGELDPAFLSRSTGSELRCFAPGPSMNRRALRLACGIGLRVSLLVALFVASLALGFAPAPLGVLGAALGLLGDP